VEPQPADLGTGQYAEPAKVWRLQPLVDVVDDQAEQPDVPIAEARL